MSETLRIFRGNKFGMIGAGILVVFIAMALLNELVWRTQSTDFWVTFKVFGLSGLAILFILTQMPFIARETRIVEAAKARD